MECPSCHSGTPDTSKFCISCDAALEALCASCGRGNRPDAKFCAECGEKLSTAKPATTTKPVTGYIVLTHIVKTWFVRRFGMS